MSAFSRIAHQSVRHLVRVACVLGLLAMAIMASSILFPAPLNIVLSMSLGHVVCIAAASCYGLAVLIDATRGRPAAARADSTESKDK